MAERQNPYGCQYYDAYSRYLITHRHSSQKLDRVEVARRQVVTESSRVDGGSIAVTAGILLLVLDLISVNNLFYLVGVHRDCD